MKYKWPLNVNNFSWIDRLRISRFILDHRNRWTQDVYVERFEREFADFVKSKHAVFVSSGSTANTLLAMYLKDTVSAEQTEVVLPAVTWTTSCSPFIREGFQPVFIDVSMSDFSIDIPKLEAYVAQNAKRIAVIFVTSLLGFTPDISELKRIESQYGVRVWLDNCEATFASVNGTNISSLFTSTTSTYFGHQLQSIEGGFIFTNDEREHEYFLMNRNHGMVRSLPESAQARYQNSKVDKRFDFYSLGNNFRNTNLNAFIGLLDFQRRAKYITARKRLFCLFKLLLDPNKYYVPDGDHIPFCLPIVSIGPSGKHRHKRAQQLCDSLSIETRPIISGFLGYQNAYSIYFDENDTYPNAKYLHEHGFYVGLYSQVSVKQVVNLVKQLNQL